VADMGKTIREQAAEAHALGLTRFNTGEPCGHGHCAERHANNGRCVECERLSVKLTRERHAQRRAVQPAPKAAR
jgi:hypothetical protein